MKSFLFLLRSDPDIDHTAPLIWKCLEHGDRVYVVFSHDYDYQADYRMQFLMTYPRLRVLSLPGILSPFSLVRLMSRLLWNYYVVQFLLRRYRIDGCFFEWGEGVQPVRKLPLIKRLQAKFAKDIRVQLQLAAEAVRVPTFCLPHGLNTKLNLDTNNYVIQMLESNGGELPFEDRNSFTVYVFNTEYHRESYVQRARMDPSRSQSWGSLRFSPQWMEVIRRICPKAPIMPGARNRSRILFFLPKWQNRVHKSETLGLMEHLSDRADVQLVLKTHPRKGEADMDVKWWAGLSSRDNVVLAPDVPSHSLIDVSDVVIDVGSSIAIEAILQGKHVIYPKYLHDNRLVFDAYGGCLIADREEKVHQYIDWIRSEAAFPAIDSERQCVIRHVVYSGKEPYDVPEYYYGRVLEYVQ